MYVYTYITLQCWVGKYDNSTMTPQSHKSSHPHLYTLQLGCQRQLTWASSRDVYSACAATGALHMHNIHLQLLQSIWHAWHVAACRYTQTSVLLRLWREPVLVESFYCHTWKCPPCYWACDQRLLAANSMYMLPRCFTGLHQLTPYLTQLIAEEGRTSLKSLPTLHLLLQVRTTSWLFLHVCL